MMMKNLRKNFFVRWKKKMQTEKLCSQKYIEDCAVEIVHKAIRFHLSGRGIKIFSSKTLKINFKVFARELELARFRFTRINESLHCNHSKTKSELRIL
jgi:hypothetical protein